MADQNITELPIKTNSGVASTDYMLGIDSAEGYQILVRDVAKYIVENYNGSTLAGSAQTIQSAVNALNSKTTVEEITATRVQDSTGGSCYVSKIGKICIATLSLKTNASLAANTVIFSDLPNASRNGFISVLDSVGNYNLLNIKTDGTIVLVNARSSIGWLYTIFAYCEA